MHAEQSHEAVATFGAGCFWGVEAQFRALPGVLDAAVGYEGGWTTNPSYTDVCRGDTGHAEVVQVRFDPTRVTYDALVNLFWSIHDPTQKDRQGPDVGSQYRSAIFVHDALQDEQAHASKIALDASGRFSNPVVTQIAPASTFWRAEEYHQQDLAKSSGGASCRIS